MFQLSHLIFNNNNWLVHGEIYSLVFISYKAALPKIGKSIFLCHYTGESGWYSLLTTDFCMQFITRMTVTRMPYRKINETAACNPTFIPSWTLMPESEEDMYTIKVKQCGNKSGTEYNLITRAKRQRLQKTKWYTIVHVIFRPIMQKFWRSDEILLYDTLHFSAFAFMDVGSWVASDFFFAVRVSKNSGFLSLAKSGSFYWCIIVCPSMIFLPTPTYAFWR